MRTLLLENMTWPDVRQALSDGFRCVIIPVASIEQHGYHLPLITDSVLGENAAVELVKRLGDALVAPVIRPGLSPHHMAMPGTLTLRPETLRMLAEDYIDCYIRHGFEKIVILAAHGGNSEICTRIVEDMREKYPSVAFADAQDLPTLEELRETEIHFDLPSGANGGHADDRETSEMLAIRPEYVRMERAVPGFTQPLTPDLLGRFFREGVGSLTEVGCVGDPCGASAARGAWYISRAAEALADSVRAQFADYSRGV